MFCDARFSPRFVMWGISSPSFVKFAGASAQGRVRHLSRTLFSSKPLPIYPPPPRTIGAQEAIPNPIPEPPSMSGRRSWSVLGPSWWDLGPSWAASGRPRSRLGPSLGLSWAVLGLLGPSWGFLGRLGGLLGDLGAVLGPSGN